VLRYDPASLSQTGVFCTTPDAYSPGSPIPVPDDQLGGGIWQTGGGLASDAADNVYLATGNGFVDPARGDYGNAILRLSPNVDGNGNLVLTTGFLAPDITNPNGADQLNAHDVDLGSGGVLLPSGTNTVVQGGKAGVLFVLDSSASNWNTSLQGVQAFFNKSAGAPPYGYSLGLQPVLWGTPAYWRGPNSSYGLVYAWSSYDRLKAFRLDLGTNTFQGAGGSPPSLDCGPSVACGSVTAAANQQAFLSLTANGNTPGTGVVWVVTNSNVLHAFDAENLGAPIWSNPIHDNAGNLTFGKWAPPTVADGKVFVGVGNNLDWPGRTFLDIYQLIGEVNAARAADGFTHVRWVANRPSTHTNTTWVLQTQSGKTSGNFTVDASQPNVFVGGVKTDTLADPVRVCAVVGNETECSAWVNPHDATKSVWFDISAEDGDNTGWWTWNGTSFKNGIPTVPWAQASRLARSFCVSLGFAGGQPNGWQGPNTVGTVCYGAAVNQVTLAARDTSSTLTTWHFPDTNTIDWATAARAAADICWNENGGQHLRGFFDGEENSSGMGLECFSASGGSGFDVTPAQVNYNTSGLTLPNPGGIIDTGSNGPNVIGWDLAARIAHDYCQANGFVGGRFDGYLSSTVLGLICY